MSLLLANSLLDGFFLSNTIGKSIVIIQLISSLAMVTVICGKFFEINFLSAVSQRFKIAFHATHDVLEYYLQHRPSMCYGLENIYKQTCESLLKQITPDSRHVLQGDMGAGMGAALTAREIALVRSKCDEAAEAEIILSEKRMTVIATVVAISPMLGLLGTVWGVLDAFADMGSAGSANLATIAPAISSALVTTVVGLIVAFPGIVFFNILNSKIRTQINLIESFANELPERIACEYQGGNA